MKQKSLRQLAKQIGVSPAYLSQIKNGKRPASSRVAEVLSNLDMKVLSSVKQTGVDVSPYFGYNDTTKALWGSAGIGRQAGLRIQCSNAWGFKSPLPHYR